jgi:hypothetical protein
MFLGQSQRGLPDGEVKFYVMISAAYVKLG